MGVERVVLTDEAVARDDGLGGDDRVGVYIGAGAGIDEERLRSVAGVALASCQRSLRMRRNLRTNLQVSLER